jgi:hypothetical protein
VRVRTFRTVGALARVPIIETRSARSLPRFILLGTTLATTFGSTLKWARVHKAIAESQPGLLGSRRVPNGTRLLLSATRKSDQGCRVDPKAV